MSQFNSTKAILKTTPLRETVNDGSQRQARTSEGSHGAPFLSLLDEKRETYFRRKYVLDRSIGAALLVLSSPLTLTLYFLVKLTSTGPGFYRQERVGLHGETFQIIKLRSMVKNAEKPGEAVWCVKNDVRVTRLGRILRKLHLDELPQLWNVTKGEMSLVGPRPERPEICEELVEQIDGYYQRNLVKPGVTGLAQINLPPDETLEDVRRKQILDLLYIQEANLWLDMRMVFATALRMAGLRGDIVMKAMRLCRRDHLRRAGQKRAPDLDDNLNIDSDDRELACAMASAAEDFHGDSIPRHPR